MLNRTFYTLSFLICIGIFSAGISHAAILRLSPGAGSFVLGSTFDVSVVMNTQGAAVNTVEAELRFPPDKLQIANPSLGKSIVQIWASPPTFSNEEGKIYFIGGIPSPGVNISDGVVQSFTFRVVSPGTAMISFGKNTSVLANDGLGTDVLKQTSPAEFRLLLPQAQGPEVFSPTHPEQGKWYKDPNPTVRWSATPNSQGFSYAIDHSPSTAPETTVATKDSEVTLQNLESGSWYFHVREKAGGSWGGTTHYALNIDTLPPAEFGVEVTPGTRTSDKTPMLKFFTTDSFSSFDHFEIKVVSLASGEAASSFFFEASSPYQLTRLETGRYEVIVRAYDKAGNTRDEVVTLQILSALFPFLNADGIDLFFVFAPWRIFFPIAITLLGILGAWLALLWRKHKHHLSHAFSEDVKKIWPRNNGKSGGKK